MARILRVSNPLSAIRLVPAELERPQLDAALRLTEERFVALGVDVGAIRRIREDQIPIAEWSEHLKPRHQHLISMAIGRPGMLVGQDGALVDDEVWGNALSNNAVVDAAIDAVGRIELANGAHIGTGFVVRCEVQGDGVDLTLLTNRHVVEAFAVAAAPLEIELVQAAQVHFGRVDGGPQGEAAPIRAVLWIHPWWDLAAIQVRATQAIAALALRAERPGWVDTPHQEELHSWVFCVGHPRDVDPEDAALALALFGPQLGQKFVMPGGLTGMERVSLYGHDVNELEHDCSTLRGASGSPVVDLEGQGVVGVHNAGLRLLDGGSYEAINLAVPGWILARDPRVLETVGDWTGAAPIADDPWGERWNDRPLSVGLSETSATVERAPLPTARPPAGGRLEHLLIPDLFGCALLGAGNRSVWPPRLEGVVADGLSDAYLRPGAPIAALYRSARLQLGGRGESLYTFGYDWRMSVEAASRQLAVYVGERWRDGVGPLNLLAHGLGGLVALRWLQNSPEVLPGIGRIVLAGVPLVGTASAAEAMRHTLPLQQVLEGLWDDGADAAVRHLGDWPVWEDLLAPRQVTPAGALRAKLLLIAGDEHPTPSLDGSDAGDGWVTARSALGLEGVSTLRVSSRHFDLLRDTTTLAACRAWWAGEPLPAQRPDLAPLTEPVPAVAHLQDDDAVDFAARMTAGRGGVRDLRWLIDPRRGALLPER